MKAMSIQSNFVRSVALAAVALGAACVGGCGMFKPDPAAQETKLPSHAPDPFENGAKAPPSAKTNFAMAKILVAKGRDRDAIFLLSRTIKQHSGYLPAYNELAGIYLRADRIGDSIEVLSAGLNQAPRDPVLNNNLGLCYFMRGDYQQAASAFHHAVVAVPDGATYRANQAMALGMLGRTAEASNAYDGVVAAESIQHNIAVIEKARQQREGSSETQLPPWQAEHPAQPASPQQPVASPRVSGAQ
jgi:tetratricopeptide (TPR) repeat protein